MAKCAAIFGRAQARLPEKQEHDFFTSFSI